MGATDRVTGFHHKEPAAADAWERIRAFIGEHLT
jgi:hypothetical protein